MNSRAAQKMFGEKLAPDGSFVKDRFDAWFEGSKVLTRGGSPLVVFHSTSSSFEAFNADESDLGSHFGDVLQAHARATPGGNASFNVVPVWLSIKSPVRLKDVGSFHADGVALQLERKGILSRGEGKRMHKEADKNWRLRKGFDASIKLILEKEGFDGIVYANSMEGKGDSFIAFRPGQIKSSIGNSGMFDPLVPDFCDCHLTLGQELEHNAIKAMKYLNRAIPKISSVSRHELKQ